MLNVMQEKRLFNLFISVPTTSQAGNLNREWGISKNLLTSQKGVDKNFEYNTR